MTSKTSICNKALRHLGVATVIDVDPDTSPQATLCKANYDELLLEVLRLHDWNFAIYRQSLNQDSSYVSTDEQYTYKYLLPTLPQYIKLINVYKDDDYVIENGGIYTNATTCKIRFVGKETDPNKYDSLFINTFSLRIAMEIGYALTSDSGLVNKMEDKFINYLSLAKDRDVQENVNTPIINSRYNQSRLSGNF